MRKVFKRIAAIASAALCAVPLSGFSVDKAQAASGGVRITLPVLRFINNNSHIGS